MLMFFLVDMRSVHLVRDSELVPFICVDGLCWWKDK